MADLLTWFETGLTWFETRLATSYQRPPFRQALIATLPGVVGAALLYLVAATTHYLSKRGLDLSKRGLDLPKRGLDLPKRGLARKPASNFRDPAS